MFISRKKRAFTQTPARDKSEQTSSLLVKLSSRCHTTNSQWLLKLHAGYHKLNDKWHTLACHRQCTGLRRQKRNSRASRRRPGPKSSHSHLACFLLGSNSAQELSPQIQSLCATEHSAEALGGNVRIVLLAPKVRTLQMQLPHALERSFIQSSNSAGTNVGIIGMKNSPPRFVRNTFDCRSGWRAMHLALLPLQTTDHSPCPQRLFHFLPQSLLSGKHCPIFISLHFATTRTLSHDNLQNLKWKLSHFPRSDERHSMLGTGSQETNSTCPKKRPWDCRQPHWDPC